MAIPSAQSYYNHNPAGQVATTQGLDLSNLTPVKRPAPQQPAPQPQAAATPSQQQTQPNNGIQQVDPSYLDAIYNPGFQALDVAGSEAQNQYNNQVSHINSNAQGLVSDLDTQVGQARTDTEKEKSQFQSVYDLANDRMARNLDWANRANLNQYGYNGAYLAGNIINQQEYLRETGQAQNTFTRGVGNLYDNLQRFINSVSDYKTKIDIQKNQQLADAQTQLQTGLNQIASQRYQLQSQKAAQVTQLHQNYIDNINQIQAYAQAADKGLEIWKEQQTQLFKQQFQAYGQQQQAGFNNVQSTFSNITDPSNYGSSDQQANGNYLTSAYVPMAASQDELNRYLQSQYNYV